MSYALSAPIYTWVPSVIPTMVVIQSALCELVEKLSFSLVTPSNDCSPQHLCHWRNYCIAEGFDTVQFFGNPIIFSTNVTISEAV